MNRGGKISKLLIALLFLLMLSFDSCEVFYCEKCTNGEESFWECSQDAIEQWENQGYNCKQ
ncbi:MAG: hypothetical protein AB9888_01440 [Bacteroidales bacterium]